MGKTQLKLFSASTTCAIASISDVLNFINEYVIKYMQIILIVISFIMTLSAFISILVKWIKSKKINNEDVKKDLENNLNDLNKLQENIKNKVK